MFNRFSKRLTFACCCLMAAALLTGCPLAEKDKNPEGTWSADMAGTTKDAKAFQATFTFNADGTVTCQFPSGYLFTGTYDMTFEVDGNEVDIFAGSITIGDCTIAWDMSLTYVDDDTMVGNASVSITYPGGSFSSTYSMTLTRQEAPAPVL